jgi:hypothetical protein
MSAHRSPQLSVNHFESAASAVSSRFLFTSPSRPFRPRLSKDAVIGK